jgi:hypothetical protein
VGAQIKAMWKNGRAEHSDAQTEKGSSFLSCCLAIVIFGDGWMEDPRMRWDGMVSAGCALVSTQGGAGTEVGVSPIMGLKIRTSWKDAGHWLFVRVGIP